MSSTEPRCRPATEAACHQDVDRQARLTSSEEVRRRAPLGSRLPARTTPLVVAGPRQHGPSRARRGSAAAGSPGRGRPPTHRARGSSGSGPQHREHGRRRRSAAGDGHVWGDAGDRRDRRPGPRRPWSRERDRFGDLATHASARRRPQVVDRQAPAWCPSVDGGTQNSSSSSLAGGSRHRPARFGVGCRPAVLESAGDGASPTSRRPSPQSSIRSSTADVRPRGLIAVAARKVTPRRQDRTSAGG